MSQSWHDPHRAELVEMLVEGKRLGDLQLLHNDFAGTVGEAPSLVGVAREDLPRDADVVLGQIVDRRK